MEKMREEMWEKQPDVLASLGGHETTRQIQGQITDSTTLESRMEILKDFWKHDIYYVSRVLKDQVVLVVFFNDCARVNEEQLHRFREDMKLAC